MMEKRGVCAGEGEAPKEKQAADAKGCCGGKPSCGADPLSKAADAAASAAKPKDDKSK